ncbi:MAG: No hits [uncultured Sulfurovum sp.]|uniref:No hits n=1 Tax=uncultured Sulfurovum sp. TaxID=269237 RepID=A0A6S6U4T1_9BACT|nr:MAG: No hits [uncultured Sulfurovum sp.]
MSIVFVSMLSSATVNTDKERYESNESIIVNYSEMEAQSSEWMAIYPASSSNDFGNIIQWKLSNADVNGSVTFEALSLGTYEVRVFNNADFLVSKQIVVEEDALTTTLETTKDIYLADEEIVAVFDNMSGNADDWIGIYPAGSSNAWENMLQWEWIEGGLVTGTQAFEAMPVGDYEVRVFFNNSFTEEAVYAFSVEAIATGVSLVLNKTLYAQNELIYINYNNMQGNNSDWIGIYPAGASFEFENVIDSKQTEGNINGEISLGGVDALPDAENNPGGLAPGNYEVRAFYNNSLTAQTVATFTVANEAVSSTVYEAATGSISPNWVHISGPTAPYYNAGRVNLKPTWINNYTNTSEYRLVFPQINTTQKVLEFDAGGVRWQPHFFIGVVLETIEGTRKMIWDPFFNHEGTTAFKSGTYLSYPLYLDIQRRSTEKLHVRLDVEKYLRILEPNNKVLSISAFMASGGDLDEIKLSSH